MCRLVFVYERGGSLERLREKALEITQRLINNNGDINKSHHISEIDWRHFAQKYISSMSDIVSSFGVNLVSSCDVSCLNERMLKELREESRVFCLVLYSNERFEMKSYLNFLFDDVYEVRFGNVFRLSMAERCVL